jgi:hypothetical protein
VWTQLVDVQHLIYWQGQCVCDALLEPTQESDHEDTLLPDPKLKLEFWRSFFEHRISFEVGKLIFIEKL